MVRKKATKHFRLAVLTCLTMTILSCQTAAPPAPVLNPPIINSPQPIATTGANIPITTLQPSPTPITFTSQLFDGQRAYQSVVDQVAMGSRITGTAPHWALGEVIMGTLNANGWQTRTQPFDYKGVTGRNLVGTKGSQFSDVIILGAHYDTRRFADQDPIRPTDPVPGANDGASGVAVLLELSRVLDVTASRKQIWLVFFDAEDNGDLNGWEWIVGSTRFANSLTITPSAVIVVDMIGDADQEIWLERTSYQPLANEIWDTAHKLGYGSYFRKLPRWSMIDDHTSFVNRGFRAINIIDFDYAHWHKTSDTPDKISAPSLERVGRTLQSWLQSAK
jgi:hypothetical protein